jgi:hypothetical protein
MEYKPFSLILRPICHRFFPTYRSSNFSLRPCTLRQICHKFGHIRLGTGTSGKLIKTYCARYTLRKIRPLIRLSSSCWIPIISVKSKCITSLGTDEVDLSLENGNTKQSFGNGVSRRILRSKIGEPLVKSLAREIEKAERAKFSVMEFKFHQRSYERRFYVIKPVH